MPPPQMWSGVAGSSLQDHAPPGGIRNVPSPRPAKLHQAEAESPPVCNSPFPPMGPGEMQPQAGGSKVALRWDPRRVGLRGLFTKHRLC